MGSPMRVEVEVEVDVEPSKRSDESASGSPFRLLLWEGFEVNENRATFDFQCDMENSAGSRESILENLSLQRCFTKH